MVSAFEVSAREVVNKDPVKATTEESISQIKNRMEEHDLRAIPVVNEKNHFKGAIGYRELVRFVQFNPEITAPEKMMHQPPEFEQDDLLVDLAELRINSGRKMLVILEGKKLAGVVGDAEFLEAFQDIEEFEDVSTGRLATRDVRTVRENDSLEKARHAMLDHNISRLPVVDADNSLTGTIDSVDILGMIVPRERQSAGGTSGDRAGTEEVNIAGGGEKERMSQVTVDQLMRKNLLSSEEHMDADEAIQEMLSEDEDDIIFVEDGYPEAIITLKDLVAYLADLAQQQTVMVQLTGVDVDEEKAAIHNKIKQQLQGSLGRKLRNPEELTLRTKKAEKDGKKHRYEIDLKLSSEYGLTTINESGWNILDVVDEALGELNRVIRDEHDRRTDHHRNR
ncbi:MAG: CBS domain-containing protein [Candidatus Nanohaloarchaea archaeon]